MTKSTSSFRENLLNLILIFTFVIPIIPLAIVLGYDHYFSNDSVSADTSTSAPSDDSEADYSEPLRAGPTPVSPAPSFSGSRSSYSCTSDCSGHDAGYEWGEEHEICDTEYDNGNSESFNEGVRAWAEDNCSESVDEEYDEEYDDEYYDYRWELANHCRNVGLATEWLIRARIPEINSLQR